MHGLESEAACLLQELANARKKAEEQSTKLAPLRQVVEEVSMVKEALLKLLSSFSQTREYRANKEALERQRKIEIGLGKDCEKTLDRDLASVKRELSNVNVQNASHW